MPTTVVFELPGPEYARIAWMHNEHLHGSETPLLQEAGLIRASLAPDGLPRTLFVNGYVYDRAETLDWASSAKRPPEHDIENWKEHWLPKIDSAADALAGFDPARVGSGGWNDALETHESLLRGTFGRLHMETMVVVLPAAQTFVEQWRDLTGDEDEARTFLQGFPNESSRRAQAVWELSRIARSGHGLAEEVRAGRVPEGASEAAMSFRERFSALLARFGHTTTMHLQDLPTWSEDPRRPMAMVAVYLDEPDEHDPGRSEAVQVERRKEAEAKLERLAAGDARARSASETLLIARHLAPVSEDHNLLGDHRLLAASRAGWLKVGAHLAAAGALRVPDDLFYLHRAEALGLLEGTLTAFDADLIDERRALQALWRSVPAPGRLGAGRGTPGGEDASVVRGTPASAGRYRGRARVVASLDNADSLEHGDILIVAATGPEWSAYFPLIGALVTDVGGPLTHGAVLSREFGIPAVVGTGDGTATIADGTQIEVDGSAGTVTIVR